MLIPVVEEVPRISEVERKQLIGSLEQARADIGAGNYEILTSSSLRAEFESVFKHGGAGNERELGPPRPVIRKRQKR
jgi:hypothetical protein